MRKKKVRRKKGVKGGKKFAWIIILIILAGLVAAIPLYLNSQKEQLIDDECKVDSDCIKVQTTCCPCNSGGEEVCVPESNASVYTPKDCPPANKLMCIAMYNCKIKSCECKEGKCGAVPL